MLVNGNAIIINTTMQKARSVGAAKILFMRQESCVNLTPIGGGGAVRRRNTNIQIFHSATGTGPISWLMLFSALK